MWGSGPHTGREHFTIHALSQPLTEVSGRWGEVLSEVKEGVGKTGLGATLRHNSTSSRNTETLHSEESEGLG